MASTAISGRGCVVATVLGLGVATACSDDGMGDPNVLPTASGSGSGSGTAGSGSGVDTDPSVDTTSGQAPSLPATYRFDCIDILELGDSDGDGLADGDAIQAMLLENTWSADIDAYKLNVLLTVRDRDDEAGRATVLVGSGVGPAAGELCTERTTLGSEQTAGFEPGVGQWQPSAGGGACAEPASGDAFGGTYTLELLPADTVYVYAEDDDGTVFNCVPGGGAPDAVPLHAVFATVTVDEDERSSAGQLTGCLVETEAQALCSCLGECSGQPNPECGGCPDGATPLQTLLGGVMPTDNCTEIMGARAYDLTVGFTTARLPLEEPMVCE